MFATKESISQNHVLINGDRQKLSSIYNKFWEFVFLRMRTLSHFSLRMIKLLQKIFFAFQQEDSDTETSNEEFLAIESFFSGKPVPMLKMKILPFKYHRPITMTSLFDTGASQSIMNPKVLPHEF